MTSSSRFAIWRRIDSNRMVDGTLADDYVLLVKDFSYCARFRADPYGGTAWKS